ncbi:MAG: PAS domain S-box protein [Gemmatimonadota bacterium]
MPVNVGDDDDDDLNDVSTRRREDDLLLQQRQVVESLPQAIALADLQGIITYVNPSFLRLWGYSSTDDVVGRPVSSFSDVAHEIVPQILEARGIWVGEARCVRRDGGRFYSRLSTSVTRDPAGKPTGMIGAFTDVMELRASEHRISVLSRLYAVLSHVSAAIVRHTSQAPLLQEICDIVVTEGQFRMARISLALPESGLIHPVARAGPADDHLNLAASGHRATASVSLSRLGVVVGSLDLDSADQGFFSEDEQQLLTEIGANISFALDAFATADLRRTAEFALAFREDQLAQVVRVSQIGVFDHDHVTGTIYWSPEARTLFGFPSRGNVTLGDLVQRIHPDDRARIGAAVQRAHDPTGNGVFEVDFRIVRDDGTVRWIESHSQTFFANGAPSRTVGGSRDVTANRDAERERVRLLERLTQAEKMESVGRLAGGIAHDFNNMLAVILGSIELAMGDLPPDHPVRNDLLEVQAAGKRSADLTRQLLAFARRQTITPSVQQLNDNVSTAMRMLSRLIGEDVELRWEPGEAPWPVKVDPSQIDQVLTNLTVNARDSLEGTGRVTIRTANVSIDEAFVLAHPDATTGDFVALSVADTGAGMDAETVEHIFEPFFTTKGPGHGTGLGLAMVYGITRQNHGFVVVESSLGAGTTVSVYLPRHDATPVHTPPEAHEALVIGGTETILVVEDEPMVLHMTRRMLEGLGYTVLSTNAPSEAIRLLETNRGKISLAVLDLVMPEMNGVELGKRLTALRPELRCMFVSGYPSAVNSTRDIIDEGTAYLQKPFSSAALARRVRAELDR